MKSNVSRLLPLGLLSAALVATAAADTPAYVTNRVTLSGKITTASESVVSQTPTTYTTISHFVTQSVTNATILDSMVTAGKIPAKTGYAIIERFSDDGDSKGFFAINSKTGSEVAVDPALFSAFMTDAAVQGPEAVTGKARRSSTGGAASVNSKFLFISSSNFMSKPAVPFVTGSHKLARSGSHSFLATDYSASIRLPLDDDTVVDAIVKSTGNVYTPARTETGTIVVTVPFSSTAPEGEKAAE